MEMIIHFRALAQSRASHPPRGWNSYDSFIWTISEQEFLQSAEVVAQRLKPHGYQVLKHDFSFSKVLLFVTKKKSPFIFELAPILSSFFNL